MPFKNGQNIRDVWIARHGASTAPEQRSCTREGVSCQRGVFRDESGRSVVETVFYAGPPFVKSHAWIGDNTGQFADPTGPSATELLWAFFEANPRNPGPGVQIAFDPVRISNERDADVSGTASGEADIKGVFVRLDGTAPQAEKTAEGTETWSVQFADLPDGRHYQPMVRVELADGTARSAAGPSFAIGNPVVSVSSPFNEHIVAGRIAVQRAPCASGFGACDASFNSMFFQFGLSPFALHAADPSGPWFVDPSHVPHS